MPSSFLILVFLFASAFLGVYMGIGPGQGKSIDDQLWFRHPSFHGALDVSADLDHVGHQLRGRAPGRGKQLDPQGSSSLLSVKSWKLDWRPSGSGSSDNSGTSGGSSQSINAKESRTTSKGQAGDFDEHLRETDQRLRVLRTELAEKTAGLNRENIVAALDLVHLLEENYPLPLYECALLADKQGATPDVLRRVYTREITYNRLVENFHVAVRNKGREFKREDAMPKRSLRRRGQATADETSADTSTNQQSLWTLSGDSFPFLPPMPAKTGRPTPNLLDRYAAALDHQLQKIHEGTLLVTPQNLGRWDLRLSSMPANGQKWLRDRIASQQALGRVQATTLLRKYQLLRTRLIKYIQTKRTEFARRDRMDKSTESTYAGAVRHPVLATPQARMTDLKEYLHSKANLRVMKRTALDPDVSRSSHAQTHFARPERRSLGDEAQRAILAPSTSQQDSAAHDTLRIHSPTAPLTKMDDVEAHVAQLEAKVACRPARGDTRKTVVVDNLRCGDLAPQQLASLHSLANMVANGPYPATLAPRIRALEASMNKHREKPNAQPGEKQRPSAHDDLSGRSSTRQPVLRPRASGTWDLHLPLADSDMTSADIDHRHLQWASLRPSDMLPTQRHAGQDRSQRNTPQLSPSESSDARPPKSKRDAPMVMRRGPPDRIYSSPSGSGDSTSPETKVQNYVEKLEKIIEDLQKVQTALDRPTSPKDVAKSRRIYQRIAKMDLKPADTLIEGFMKSSDTIPPACTELQHLVASFNSLKVTIGASLELKKIHRESLEQTRMIREATEALSRSRPPPVRTSSMENLRSTASWRTLRSNSLQTMREAANRYTRSTSQGSLYPNPGYGRSSSQRTRANSADYTQQAPWQRSSSSSRWTPAQEPQANWQSGLSSSPSSPSPPGSFMIGSRRFFKAPESGALPGLQPALGSDRQGNKGGKCGGLFGCFRKPQTTGDFYRKIRRRQSSLHPRSPTDESSGIAGPAQPPPGTSPTLSSESSDIPVSSLEALVSQLERRLAHLESTVQASRFHATRQAVSQMKSVQRTLGPARWTELQDLLQYAPTFRLNSHLIARVQAIAHRDDQCRLAVQQFFADLGASPGS